jgi:Ca2+-binding EF-hand superfamily protein
MLYPGLFIQADTDGSGYLDRQEFSAVLRAGGLNLTERSAAIPEKICRVC